MDASQQQGVGLEEHCSKCVHTWKLHIGTRGECINCECEHFEGVDISLKNDSYLEILDEMRQLHIKKAADYGGGTGTDNLRASAEFGIQPWIGCVLRMNDKVTRIKSFVRNGRLENESLDDSLIDIAAYAILALTLLREANGR